MHNFNQVPLVVVTYFSRRESIPKVHLAAGVLVVTDVEGNLRQKIGHGEEIPEDAVVIRQLLHMKHRAALLPVFLHLVQRDFNWWDEEEAEKLSHSFAL